jgi:hypothetical protein
MDFSIRQVRHPMVKLVGIIVVLALSLWARPDSCPAVEAPLPAGFSVDNERIVASAVQFAAGAVASVKVNEDGNTVYGRIPVPSRTFRRHRKFQHILHNTPKDHGLAPEKSHDADMSMK